MRYENKTLFLEGELTLKTVNSLLIKLEKLSFDKIDAIDFTKITKTDSAGVAFVDTLLINNNSPKLVNLNRDIEKSFKTFSSIGIEEMPKPKKDSFLVQIGAQLFELLLTTKSAIFLISDIFYWSFIGLFNKKGQKKDSVIHQSLFIGVDALGIIALLSFILGLILALQSAAQLRQFGANIFVADLMAVSMVTEMGPFLTAIIIAGRSGSSIASEIATMKVTEELDALKIMAINPVRYVVVPKFQAMTLCMPLLVIVAVLIGILGGLIIAVTYLDLSAVAYINRIFEVVKFRDTIIGLGKSFFFAWAIVIIGSYYGFNAEGGAEGVGKVTTKAVVASIFWVIILDAINSMVFYF